MYEEKNIIQINDKESYVLLDKIVVDNKVFFFGAKLDEEQKRILGTYDFFEVNQEDLVIVDDQETINNLHSLFIKKYINS